MDEQKMKFAKALEEKKKKKPEEESMWSKAAKSGWLGTKAKITAESGK
jgi:hypothetical protein